MRENDVDEGFRKVGKAVVGEKKSSMIEHIAREMHEYHAVNGLEQ